MTAAPGPPPPARPTEGCVCGRVRLAARRGNLNVQRLDRRPPAARFAPRESLTRILPRGTHDPQRISRQHDHPANAPWLAGKPEQPFHAGTPDPRWAPPDASGEVVERAADADRH